MSELIDGSTVSDMIDMLERNLCGTIARTQSFYGKTPQRDEMFCFGEHRIAHVYVPEKNKVYGIEFNFGKYGQSYGRVNVLDSKDKFLAKLPYTIVPHRERYNAQKALYQSTYDVIRDRNVQQ